VIPVDGRNSFSSRFTNTQTYLLLGHICKYVQWHGVTHTTSTVHSPCPLAEFLESAFHLMTFTRYAMMLAPVLIKGPHGFIQLKGILINIKMSFVAYGSGIIFFFF
jgi:hypothetical protein